MGAPLVEINGLAVSYGPVVALAGVSGSFLPGPTGLLGPNGAGKTTLLKTLLGFLKPDRGSHDRVRPRSHARAARGPAPHRVHARGGLPPARHDRRALRRVRGGAVGAAARRGHEPRARGPLLRRAGGGALPHGRHVLDRHEAAREAGAGAGARPGPAAPRRADQRARSGGARGDAGAHPRRGGAPRDEPHPVLASACATWRRCASA